MARDIAALDGPDQPLAAFALLVALAPHQVDPSVVAAFREHRPADEDLVGAAGWAAFTAARRVGGWLAVTRSQDESDMMKLGARSRRA